MTFTGVSHRDGIVLLSIDTSKRLTPDQAEMLARQLKRHADLARESMDRPSR